MKTGVEMLPCPMCGGRADTGGHTGTIYVECQVCGVLGSCAIDEDGAIAAWNTRHTHPAATGSVRVVPVDPPEKFLAMAPEYLMSRASMAILWGDMIAAAPTPDAAASGAAVPAGCVLVPVEPTKAMIEAGSEADAHEFDPNSYPGDWDHPDNKARATWAAMLNAAHRPMGAFFGAVEALERFVIDHVGNDDTPEGIEVDERAKRAVAVLRTMTAAAPKVASDTDAAASEAGEVWQDIASAPRDGTPFIATLIVHNLSGQRWWETHVIWADDETGEVASECEAGWTRVDDYSHWMPMPAPPAALTTQGGAEG